MKKVCIITLGCKVNQYESGGLEKALTKKGFNVCMGLEKADAYIVNTCAVTNEAEKKSRMQLTKILSLDPDAKIFVCGCSSQNNPERFKRENVVAIYGTSNKDKLVDLICEQLGGKGITEPKISNEIVSHYEDVFTAGGDRTRVVIKIQDGCNNFCSYCLIPYLRGRERSRSLTSIKSELERIPDAKEVIFTGINLSNYGKDLLPAASLKDVAILMREYPNIRFRFSSLEQDIITDDFLKVLKATKNFCPHFHLSLQNGCDKTLKLMNRKYSSQQFYDKLVLIRKYFDNPSITTDVIVGFPSETEEDSHLNEEFVKKCAFAKMHIFRYSVRSGTVASRMKNVATNIKEREERLEKLDKQMQRNYIESCIGHKYTGIVEVLQNGYYICHTENYIKCYVKADISLAQNQSILLEIEQFKNDGALAKIVSY